MREIKFRVWDGEKYISLSKAFCLEVVGVQYDRKDSFELEPFYSDIALEQYTGLKDKNGVEIYEGDVLDFEYGFLSCTGLYPRAVGPVEFHEGAFGCLEIESQGFELWEIRDVKIIGNIHDNAELLEVPR